MAPVGGVRPGDGVELHTVAGGDTARHPVDIQPVRKRLLEGGAVDARLRNEEREAGELGDGAVAGGGHGSVRQGVDPHRGDAILEAVPGRRPRG